MQVHLFYLQKEDCPLTFINIVALFVFEVLAGLEVDGMAQVFPLFENVDDGRGTPAINILDLLGSVSVKLDNPKEDRSAEANQCCGSKELCS